MNATTPCPECGKPLPAGSDHCPACLMAQAIASRTLDGGPREIPPPPAPEDIADKFPQFEILECLGRGGMGVVYKARQKSLNRLVALKILAPERERDARFAERFAREAELLAKLSHPHIVTIHDFGETGGLYYLVMEFINGVNLRDLLRDGKMPPEQALAIVPPICDALQFAHEHGIVHRDIKPENILLDREGRVKIADFGIATLAGGSAEKAGTPAYMAPEQSGGAAGIDHRADIYALGVVLYEMLTGERPTAFPVAPSRRVQVDVRLDEVVLRALAHQPERRYQTAGDFHTMLGEVTRQVVTVPPPVAAPAVPASAEPPITVQRVVELAWAVVLSWALVFLVLPGGSMGIRHWLAQGPFDGVVAAMMAATAVVTALSLALLEWVRPRLAGNLRHLVPFAPALLLVVAWGTSGLEKGAVLVLGILLVAGLVIQALVSRRVPPQPGEGRGLLGAALVIAATLAAAGAISTPSGPQLGRLAVLAGGAGAGAWVALSLVPQGSRPVFWSCLSKLAWGLAILYALYAAHSLHGLGSFLLGPLWWSEKSRVLLNLPWWLLLNWMTAVALPLVAHQLSRLAGPRDAPERAKEGKGPLLVAAVVTLAILAKAAVFLMDRSFRPEVTRLLRVESDGIPCALDFQTGDLLMPDGPPPAADAVLRDNSLHFFHEGRIQMPGAVPKDFADWTVAEAVLPGVGTGFANALPITGSGTVAVPFASGDGAVGVLEVKRNWLENGKVRGVTVRYRLVPVGTGPLHSIRAGLILRSR